MEKQKIKVLLFTTSLDLGGITTFLINLIDYLVKNNFSVEIMYSSDKYNLLNKFSQNVKLTKYIPLNKYLFIFKVIIKGHLIDLLKIKFRNRFKISPIKSIQRIQMLNAMEYSAIKKEYDFAISSSEFFCNYFVARNICAKRKIAWYHPDLSKIKMDIQFETNVLKSFYKIVCVSKSGFDAFKLLFPEYTKKVMLIYNLIDIKNIYKLSKTKIYDVDKQFKGLNILTVSRIDLSSKRSDRIIKLAQVLIKNKIYFKWYIVGTGNDLFKLQSMITNNNLNNSIFLLGSKKNPYPYFKFANVFVLTSQYEGKPIVIDEALSLGLPVITTNYSEAKNQVPKSKGFIINNDDSKMESQFLYSINKILAKNYFYTRMDFKYNDLAKRNLVKLFSLAEQNK